MKKYDIFWLAKLYMKNFYIFIVKYTDIDTKERALCLFEYILKVIYEVGVNIQDNDYKDIEKYGNSCIFFIKGLPDTPKSINTIDIKNKNCFVNFCVLYANKTSLFDDNNIQKGREIDKIEGKN